jgi:hypothetical protein
MSNDDSKFYILLGCATAPTILLLSFMSYLLSAWSFVTLWDWFVVTNFNVPTVSYYHAIGLMLLVGLTRRTYITYYKNMEEDIIKTAVTNLTSTFLAPVLAVAIGWFLR